MSALKKQIGVSTAALTQLAPSLANAVQDTHYVVMVVLAQVC